MTKVNGIYLKLTSLYERSRVRLQWLLYFVRFTWPAFDCII